MIVIMKVLRTGGQSANNVVTNKSAPAQQPEPPMDFDDDIPF